MNYSQGKESLKSTLKYEGGYCDYENPKWKNYCRKKKSLQILWLNWEATVAFKGVKLTRIQLRFISDVVDYRGKEGEGKRVCQDASLGRNILSWIWRASWQDNPVEGKNKHNNSQFLSVLWQRKVGSGALFFTLRKKGRVIEGLIQVCSP